MAGTGTKRITELTEASNIQSGDYIAVDSNARGTKKVSTDTLATSAALTAETNARTGADEQMSERMDGIEEQTALIQNPTKTLSGALVSFTDGADMPMVACTASIVPKQSGTGTPSPDNVRQISGWESVNVTDAGKNIYNGEDVTIIGRPVERGTTLYTQVFDGTFTNATLYAKTLTADWVAIDSFSQYKHTLTINRDDILEIKISNSAYRDLNNAGSHLMASFTDFDTYEPYAGTTTTVNLGRTVYGGTLDVVSGVLTVAKVGVDLGSLTWSKYGNYTDKDRYVTTDIDSTANNDETNAICSIYPRLWGANGWWISSGAGKLSIFTTYEQYLSVSAFKTAMSGQILCYPRATPQTYQLTPTQINTLLGENNVWADSGDVEITYRRDISIVLENLENALSGSNSLNTMMMSAPTENTAEEPTEDEAEDDMR